VAGSCEDVNEHSGSIKYGEFLDKLSVLFSSLRRALLHGVCYNKFVYMS
jgi:hypothetical protein